MCVSGRIVDKCKLQLCGVRKLALFEVKNDKNHKKGWNNGQLARLTLDEMQTILKNRLRYKIKVLGLENKVFENINGILPTSRFSSMLLNFTLRNVNGKQIVNTADDILIFGPSQFIVNEIAVGVMAELISVNFNINKNKINEMPGSATFNGFVFKHKLDHVV